MTHQICRGRFVLGLLFLVSLINVGPLYGDGMAPEQGHGVDIPFVSQDTCSALKSVAAQCRTAIEGLWQQRATLPLDQQRSFDVSIGRASVNCDTLQKHLKSLMDAADTLTAYHQSINAARQLMAR